MDDFELHKSGWFTAQNVEPNEFLNQKLESDQYGLWYSVKFTGDASTHLWQTKTKPEEGKKYWGWLEQTKSGKSTKFKWDKQNAPGNDSAPAGGSSSLAYKADPVKQDNIHKSVALEQAINFGLGKLEVAQVLQTADKFYAWLKGTPEDENKPKAAENSSQEPLPDEVHFPEEEGEEINLDGIPF